MSISPWELFARKDSPDGLSIATFDDAFEIAMGAPTRGTLTVTKAGYDQPISVIHDASGSVVWSSDSKMLAFPRWTENRDQNLCVLNLIDGKIEATAGRYDVLQLDSFHDGLVVGVDSPIYRPKQVRIQILPTPKDEEA